MKLMACEIQGNLGTVRLEAPDQINQLKPGNLLARYCKFRPDVIPESDDQLIAAQKICLRIGYDFPEEAHAVGVLIGMMRFYEKV